MVAWRPSYRNGLVAFMCLNLFSLLFLVAATPVAAQIVLPCPSSSYESTYVVLRDSTRYCGEVRRTEGFFRGSRVEVGDSLKIALDQVEILRTEDGYFRRTADGAHLVERTRKGRLDLYTRVETMNMMMPGSSFSTPGGSFSTPGTSMFNTSRTDYVARAGEAPQKAHYSVVLKLVADNPQSVRHLDTFRTKSRVGYSMIGGGIALFGVGAATTNWKGDSPKVSPLLFVGMGLAAIGPWILHSRSTQIEEAISTYNNVIRPWNAD